MSTLSITGNAHGPITEADVKVQAQGQAPTFTDDGALKLVVQDARRAEMWLGEKQWALAWRECDVLYQSPRVTSAWENGGTSHANVQRFTVAKHVNSIVPTMMSGIFYDSPPFVIRPRGRKVTQNTVRAKSKLWGALLDEMKFETECEKGIESMVLKGTGVWKWGCYTERKIVKRYVRKGQPKNVVMPITGAVSVATAESDEFDCKEVPVDRWHPFFESRALGTILVAPGWRHSNEIAKAAFVIDRQYMTFKQLNELRGQKGYEGMPNEEALKALFFPPVEVAVAPAGIEQMQQANPTIHHAAGREEKQTEDPFAQPLKVDERWDGERVMTVVQDKLVIRNEEHGLGCIPFLSSNWWNIENAGFGLGLGRLIGSDQRVEAGALNAALDVLALSINQQYLRSRGANVPTQQIRSRLGGIIDVDGDVTKAFKKLDGPSIPQETWAVIQNAKQAGESTSGADEAFTQGNLPQKGGSSAARSATGAGAIAAASANRIAGPVGRFVKNVFIPFLIHLDEMINERMPLKQIREVLDDELTEAETQQFDPENFLNARLQIEVLAGAHLAAKKAMAQALPLLIQIFENPHLLESLNAMGWTVDVKELFDMMMEMSEWKNTRQVVRPMSKEEQQMFQQNSAAQSAQQRDLVKIDAKHQATMQENDQKAEAHLAEKLMTSAADRATGYEERVAMEHALAPRMSAPAEAGQFNTTGA